MKSRQFLLPVLALAVATLAAGSDAVKLTALERSQGWRLLFDGVSAGDWRGYRANALPANWHVREQSLTGAAGLALASVEEYGDFELLFDWKVAPGGHGEVYFRVSEDGKTPEETGPVMELAGHGDKLAGNGGLNEPDRAITPQFDVWYRARITVYGKQVEYWINGERVAGFALGSPDWKRAVAGSRFKAFPDFGALPGGRLVLAGDGVAFRNVKIRAL
ncbi:MAG: DUF1080 domain-containing protein [Opitutae bacterium]|nr:DUF1080 domain-containing protein [Opitutae bacterium]